MQLFQTPARQPKHIERERLKKTWEGRRLGLARMPKRRRPPGHYPRTA
nr:MAG TPA: hypothetical protein [Bacteriophage sp.]